MDKEKAREIARRIRDEIEDLLDEKNITIPSADREGVPGEARLYGEENSRFEEATVDLLLGQPDAKVADRDVGDASHPLRQLAIRICDEFEELLAEKNLKIPSTDRTSDPDEACLYGSEYYQLEDAIVDILVDELDANDKTAATTGGIADEARRAVEAMRRRMAMTPEGSVAEQLAESERPG
ncbi:unnamed protein product [marine sediment metagenome]|uniref:Uncharacterized protein n=1 Tax=marine sediment metagenome TaxID=412755 RepID=X0T534_9ZZZZ